MNPPFLRQSSFVCRSCWKADRLLPRTAPLLAKAALVKDRRSSSSTSIPPSSETRHEGLYKYPTQSTSSYPQARSTRRKAKTVPRAVLSGPASILDRLIADSKRICSSPTIPDELDVLEILETSRQLSEILVYGETYQSMSGEEYANSTDTPTSSILGLVESTRETAKAPLQMSVSFRQRASAALAENLRDLLCDPKIYISPPILQVYVRIQVLLGKPQFLPEVFHHYAHKPVPRPPKLSRPPSSTATAATPTPTYTSTFPRNPKNAIPPFVASAALTSAIALKSLPLALTIIDTTVATPAFRLAKVMRRASTPFAFLALTPFCAYTISTYFAHHWQNTYDPIQATWLCAAGIMTYVASSATLGFVAVTTSNDQMQRVTWLPGTRLRDRWLREEERAAFDRLALAWGFRERWRWGEERGEEWEALREFCAMRGMIVDKTALLDGMG
jgi:hypothetical protein